MNTPCFKCTERHPHCHAECKEYKELQREVKRINQVRLESKGYSEYKIDTAVKHSKERFRRRRK